ncbi:hypothetical protein KIN20_011504 [Parelaphostrongylus tenuis]|uniref:Uncharacterized protein n=1 Tax=Parelaphostrongylus tenuis TaxID=148309 RepID=A0AAD5ME57_PARTN|nr:hypothetical protein KIN20_011504 [Parelaphostrongylus tenuis]
MYEFDFLSGRRLGKREEQNKQWNPEKIEWIYSICVNDDSKVTCRELKVYNVHDVDSKIFLLNAGNHFFGGKQSDGFDGTVQTNAPRKQ